MGANEQEQAQFVALWQRNLGNAPGQAEAVYARLVQLYCEPHRHYHTLAHIHHCLHEFNQAASLMDHPDAVAMALWFHDAIYVPGAMDNERRSAGLFREWSAAVGAAADFQTGVSDLVMVTTHRTPPPWRDGQLVVFQTWISYQNPKFISVDKETNNDVMHFVEFGETNRLSN